MKLVYVIAVLAILSALIRPRLDVEAQSPNWPGPPYAPTNISFSTSGNQTLATSPALGTSCVFGMSLTNASTTTATTITILDGTTTLWTVYLADNGGSANWELQNGNAKNPYFIMSKGNNFVISSSAAVQIDGGLYAAVCPLF
jgi:hypothetical protein